MIAAAARCLAVGFRQTAASYRAEIGCASPYETDETVASYWIEAGMVLAA